MVQSDDANIDKMLEEIKNLYKEQGSRPDPSHGNVIPSSGGYRPPIHGSWNSSGGFDLVSKRPNGRIGHQGVDMRAYGGTPVYPMMPGVVSGVGTDPLGGNVVNIQHASGIRTYYAHLSSVKVHKGDKVDYDTVIGNVGNTGNALHTFPHLHFQVWKDGQIMDPAKFFPVPKYTDLSAEEKQRGQWLSEKARDEATSFKMSDHLQQKRASRADQLLKLSAHFCDLATNSIV